MLIRRVITNAKTGKTTEEWIDDPNAITEDQAKALDAIVAQQEANGRTIEQQAEQAIANLRAYRDLASPTPAQTAAAVKLLCRVAISLIRLQLRRFDAVE